MPTTLSNAQAELKAVNEILASVGQAPVTTIYTQTLTLEDGSQVETQTNPDVAIAYDTLQQVSREVQAEGWTFNQEFSVPFVPNANNEIEIPGTFLQVDLTPDYREEDAVLRDGKLYDRNGYINGKTDPFKWNKTVKCDVVRYLDWVDLPYPIQDYIVARAASIVSSRIVGDTTQYQMLQQKEAYNRALALEYDCNQGDYTMFGHPRGENYYTSYQPYHALYR